MNRFGMTKNMKKQSIISLQPKMFPIVENGLSNLQNNCHSLGKKSSWDIVSEIMTIVLKWRSLFIKKEKKNSCQPYRGSHALPHLIQITLGCLHMTCLMDSFFLRWERIAKFLIIPKSDIEFVMVPDDMCPARWMLAEILEMIDLKFA